jgi:hypothetical protein
LSRATIRAKLHLRQSAAIGGMMFTAPPLSVARKWRKTMQDRTWKTIVMTNDVQV